MVILNDDELVEFLAKRNCVVNERERVCITGMQEKIINEGKGKLKDILEMNAEALDMMTGKERTGKDFALLLMKTKKMRKLGISQKEASKMMEDALNEFLRISDELKKWDRECKENEGNKSDRDE